MAKKTTTARVSKAKAPAKAKAAKAKVTKAKVVAKAKPKAKAAAKPKAAAKAAPKTVAKRVTATPANTTDKAHLTSVIQAQTGASKTASKDALEAVLETVQATLKKGQKVQLLGFGTFEVAKRKARQGRNPATGEPIKIKASKTVRFRAGTKLKAGV